MTRMQMVLSENPNIVPELLVAFHCPVEYGLMDTWPPYACPSGGAPCTECWNREIPEGKEGKA